jgi:hypothetical protein
VRPSRAVKLWSRADAQDVDSVPERAAKLERGAEALADYQFGKKQIHHLFCSTCGVRSFARGNTPDGAEMIAINARCLDGVDVNTLKVKQYDGKRL